MLFADLLDCTPELQLDESTDLRCEVLATRLQVPEEVQLALVLVANLQLELLDLVRQLQVSPLQHLQLAD